VKDRSNFPDDVDWIESLLMEELKQLLYTYGVCGTSSLKKVLQIVKKFIEKHGGIPYHPQSNNYNYTIDFLLGFV
jgi:hypothetical protein